MMTTTTLPDNCYALETEDLAIYYGTFWAVKEVNFKLIPRKIPAIIGSSGCGKSMVIRSFNRMNDYINGSPMEGSFIFHGMNLASPEIDPMMICCKIGMVFQRLKTIPKSIYENIAKGVRINEFRENMDQLVERLLRETALWAEVKAILNQSTRRLTAVQHQRLCIARVLAVRPDNILMDEPSPALVPIANLKNEEFMRLFASTYTIIFDTLKMQKAALASDYTAFINYGYGPRRVFGGIWKR
jgi:phosphate transport system ATP-binding protein